MMTIELAHAVGPSRIDIAYERLGDPSAPPVLLVMGLGAQLVAWPDGFCTDLVGHGFHVIRFDNRDVGQSTRFTGAPNFAAAMTGDTSSAIYNLSDMAADTVGLLDKLGLSSVHLVGASMGGYIAQTIAIEHPARVRSLTSIMSSTGDRSVGQPHPASAALFANAPPKTRTEAADRAIANSRIIGSTGFTPDLEGIADRASRAFDRGFDPGSFLRQGVAVLASGDRTPRLRQLAIPTLVVHGTVDKLVDVSGGHATAAAIPGAELWIVEGMGHDLPKPLWPELAAKITETVKRGEATRA